MVVSAVLVFATVLACCHAQSAYITESHNTHNSYRETHHSPPLTLDSSLCDLAYQCAEYYAGKGTIDHSCPYKNGAGENLAYSWSSAGSPSQSAAAKQAVDGWYNEVNNYDYNNPGDTSKGVTGHFTQSIWKSSTSFGIGSYQDTNAKSTYTCALYSPAGNIVWGGTGDRYRFYRENVLAP